jgi:hypothetical protein
MTEDEVIETFIARGHTRLEMASPVSGAMNSYEAAYEYGADMLRLGNWASFQVEKRYVLGPRQT